jgi:hypothetical protein
VVGRTELPEGFNFVNYDKKVDARSRIRKMPRVKHQHNYTRIVQLHGNKARWGCASCPAIDRYWVRSTPIPNSSLYLDMTVPQVRVEWQRQAVAATRSTADPGWTSHGRSTRRQKPSGGARKMQRANLVADDVVRAVEHGQLNEMSFGFSVDKSHVDSSGVTVIDQISQLTVVVGDDNSDRTSEELDAMTVRELKYLADSMKVNYTSKTKKADFVASILKAQEK